MKKRIFSEIIAFVLFIAVLISSVAFLSRAYLPELYDYGSTWHRYGKEDKNSIDVMFFGSSLTFCDIIPAKIYEETGITSYVMGAAECTMPYMYYYVRQALETQTPKVIFAEVSSMFFDEYTNFTDKTLGYMPYTSNRLAATLFAAEPEARPGLLFPLYSYHSRWEEVKLKNYVSRPDETIDMWAGYTQLNEAGEEIDRITREVDEEKINFEKNKQYLGKLIKLCEDKGIALELFIVPSCYTYSDENIERIKSAADGAEFTDFNDVFDELGLDLSTDFYDRLHFNIFGAEKFSAYLADYIEEKYSLPKSDHNAELWQERVKLLNDTIDELNK